MDLWPGSSHQEASCLETEPSPPCSDCAPVSRPARIRQPRPSSPPPTLPTPRPPRSDGPPPGSASGTASPPTSTTRARSSATTAPTRAPARSSGRTAPSRTSAPWVGETAGHSPSTSRARWSVSSSTATGATHAFLWQNGTMRDLGAAQRGFQPANWIDGSGRVVGYTENLDGTGERAFLWENGRMRRLAGLDTVASVANGIDNQGRIVGWYGDPPVAASLPMGGGYGDRPRHARRGLVARPIATVGGKIVGWSTKATGVQRAFVWERRHHDRPGRDRRRQAVPRTRSTPSGPIVGWSQQPDSQPRAFIWRDGVMSAIAVGEAEDINKAGWVVGSGSISFPVLWKETTDPPPPAGSITVGTSYFLSDRNWTTDPAVDTVAVGTRVTWTWVTRSRGAAHRAIGRHAELSQQREPGWSRRHVQRHLQPGGHVSLQLCPAPGEHVREGGGQIAPV